MKKLLISLSAALLSIPSYAGIDWSKYGDAPVLDFETSCFFAVALVILYIIFQAINNFGSEDSKGGGCLVLIICPLMVMCFIGAAYFWIPLGIILIIYKEVTKKKN